VTVEPLDLTALSVVLTAGCNLRCAYCYQNAKQARSMDRDTLQTALDLLRDERRRRVRLLFTGGEPLLQFGSIERAVAYVDAIRPRDLDVQYELVTNGTLLDDKTAAFLARHRFEVQIGFDGVPAAQDLRGRGTFARLDSLLDTLRTTHPAFLRSRVSVAITVVPRTIPILADSVEYVLSKGVTEILISPAITHEPGWRDEASPELDRQLGRIYRLSLDRYRRTGKVPLPLFRKTGRFRRRCRPSLPMCPVADRHHVVIDVDGQAYGCVLFAESYQRFATPLLRSCLEPLRLGDVRALDLPGRLAAFRSTARVTPLFNAKEEKYSSFQSCRTCRYLNACAICPVSIAHQPGNHDPRRVPDFPCTFTRLALAYRGRFPRQLCLTDLLRPHARPPAAIWKLLMTR
jgi:sulfatase maturation enzyme AslB (radical SAM superfamily)